MAPARAMNDTPVSAIVAADPRPGQFESGRLQLAYWEWGDRGKPPILLIHGGRDHARSWDDVAQALASDWHVIAPDLRGHGFSAWAAEADYDVWQFVSDLHALLDQLGLRHAALVAHSFGGHVAWRFAALYPERVSRLVIVEGLSPLPRGGESKLSPDKVRAWLETRAVERLRQAKRFPDLARAVERMTARNPRLSEERAYHLAEHGTKRNPDGTLSFRYDPAITFFSPLDLPWPDTLAYWGAITCPVLLVYGAESGAVDPVKDGRARAFSDARSLRFEHAGHWVQHDRAADFISAVSTFLREPEGKAQAT